MANWWWRRWRPDGHPLCTDAVCAVWPCAKRTPVPPATAQIQPLLPFARRRQRDRSAGNASTPLANALKCVWIPGQAGNDGAGGAGSAAPIRTPSSSTIGGTAEAPQGIQERLAAGVGRLILRDWQAIGRSVALRSDPDRWAAHHRQQPLPFALKVLDLVAGQRAFARHRDLQRIDDTAVDANLEVQVRARRHSR